MTEEGGTGERGTSELSRRRLLRLGAMGALAAVGAGYGPRTRAVAAAPARSPKPNWAKLSGQLSGRLSLPGSPSYPIDRELYNPLFDSTRPAAIAFCASTSDVARCVTFARGVGLPLVARGGGHSYGGYSTSGGLVIDVSLMSHVALSAAAPKTARVATVGAGPASSTCTQASSSKGFPSRPVRAQPSGSPAWPSAAG